MLEDRDYMRRPSYRDPMFPGFRWSWTVLLIICYVVVFLMELAARQFFPHNHFFQGYATMTANGLQFVPGYLPLSLEGIEHGYLWQLVTYQFMHAGFWHIFLNAWVIYIFGREMETVLGGKKFLTLMFSAGIVGGVFQVLAAWIWPQAFGGSVVGASAGAFGLITAFALMFPHREFTLLLFFILPVHMRARTLLIISIVIAATGVVFHNVFMPHIAHVAHLGGMAMGWFFVRFILQGDWSRLTGTLRPFKPRERRMSQRVTVEKDSGDDFAEDKVDAILDKISAHGIQSLTAHEREVLESARKKMTRR